MTIDPARTPAPASGQIPGMPFQPGELITPKTLTEGEKKILKESGWKEGDPVFSNLAEAVAEAKKSMGLDGDEENIKPPVSEDSPPLKMPEEQDIDSLSPEKQREYQEYLASVIAQAKYVSQPVDEDVPAMDPSVLEAVQQSSGEPRVVDDTQQETYDAGAKKEQGAEEAKQKAELCARCGWPKSFEDPIEITEEDKDHFLQSLFGARFTKTFKLYNGKIEITCRTLTQEEVDLCWKAASEDFNNDTNMTLNTQIETLNRYRTGLQLASIRTPGKFQELPASADEWKEGDENPAKTAWNKVKTSFLTNEIIHRSVMSLVNDFNDMVLKLESNARNPDFWTAADA